MAKKTPDSRLPFGKHRGLTLRQCPADYLEWMSGKLADSDLHEWAKAAGEALEQKTDEQTRQGDLEAQADELLRQAGINPKKPG